MTCFWNGIMSALTIEDFTNIHLKNKPNIQQFIEILKNKNIPTTDILWQNNQLTNKEISENKEHISSFDINSINSGYLCSTCDPFLLLIAALFKVNIEHRYNNHMISYRHKTDGGEKYLKFSSDTGHFWKS